MTSSLSPSVFVSMLKMNQVIHDRYMWYTLKNGNTRYAHIYSQSSVTKRVVGVQQDQFPTALMKALLYALTLGNVCLHECFR